MIRNFFITALRNFRKNKTYALLNIFGLGVGLACCLVVYTIITFEYSFDDTQTKKDRIYRVVQHYHGDQGIQYIGSSNYAIPDAIKNDISGVELVAPLHGPVDHLISLTDRNGTFQIFREERVLFADSNFLKMMDFEILQGADYKALNEPNRIFLTQRMAEKYFPDQNAIGATLTLDNQTNLKVAGIMQDIPNNTSLPFDFLVSYPTFAKAHPHVFNEWFMYWAGITYVMLPEGADPAATEEKMLVFKEKYLDEENREKAFYKLQPLTEIHTDEKYGDGNYYVAPAMMLNTFIFLALLLLGTGCLNFINLSTAQAIRRSKEVGIRKTLGSSKKQLTIQFLSETLVIVLLAMGFAFTLGQFLLKGFNSLITQIEYNLTFSSEIILFAIVLALVVTFLAGFYPAMILSGYQPVKALKSQITLKKGSGNINFRRALVVIQFAMANILLISTVIITAQMNFVKSKDLGFDYKDRIIINFSNADKIDAVKEELANKSYVESVTRTWGPPQYTSNWNQSFWARGERYVDGNDANIKMIDEKYLSHYDLKLLAGENIREQMINDSTFNILVNETLLRKLGWTNDEAIGRWIDMGYRDGKIVGVVNDFHNWTLNREIGAVVFMYLPEHMQRLGVQLKGDLENRYMGDIEATFRQFYPNDLFESTILEDQVQERYMLESMMHKIVNLIAVLSVVISIMGLYGLVSFMANRNAKTIGIRKVFGASMGSILGIFAKEYMILLLLAFVTSVPLAYLMMSEWINTFVYHIDIGVMYFLVGFVISLAIAAVAVGYRSYRAATANPIQALRYE